MLFQKPKDVKYTDMCIYIDNIVARGNPTEKELELVFQYLFHIAFMLAHKKKYFNKAYYYEEFAIYFATDIMHRLFFNPRLNEVDENGEPVLTPIKSVLNYMKGVLYARKVGFEQQAYCQKYAEFSEIEYLYSFNKDPYDSVREKDIELYLKCISKTVKHVVYKNNPYKRNKCLMKNIYISCLLTVLNGITLSKADVEKLQNTYSNIESKYRLLEKIYADNKRNSLILYHLEESYVSYIKVLSNKVFQTLKQDLLELSSQNYGISDEVMTSILFLELNGESSQD